MPFTEEIYYYMHNDGSTRENPPLVLIHGAGGDHLYWPPEIRRLPGTHVIAIDLPGHGKSPGEGEASIQAYAGRVHAWLSKLGEPGAVFAGHSMGAAIALSLALYYPDCVLGLVLVSSGARLKVNPAMLELLAEPSNYSQAVELIIRWSFSLQASPSLLKLAGQRMAEASPEVLYHDLSACNDYDVSSRMAEIDVPTLVICGAADRMTPLRLSNHLASSIPKAQLEVVQDAGHMVMLERPQAVGAAIAKFFSSIDL
jgi:pimeloyl-ACP methyl ester carboxylesterase